MNTTTKILMSAGISTLLIAALVVVGVGVATPAKAQVFSLSEAQLPPGVYAVTPEGYWPVQTWTAAHPGKPVPASIIVIPEPVQVPTQTIKVKTVHEHDDNHHHKFWKWKDRDDRGCTHHWQCGGSSTGGGSSSGGSSSSGGCSSSGGG